MNSEEERELNCKNCTVEHDLKGYVTVKMLAIVAFAVMTPVSTLILFMLDDAVSDAKTETKLKLLPMVEKERQNELRIVRLENDSSKTITALAEIAQNTRDIKTDLKYNFVTTTKHDEDLNKKVDMDRINKIYLKAQ